MKDDPLKKQTPIHAERARRFVLLLERYRTQIEAADALGFNQPSMISAIKKKRRNIGEEVARRLEELGDLKSGVFVNPLETSWNPVEKDTNSLDFRSSVINTSRNVSDNTVVYGDVTHVRIETHESWIDGETQKESRMTVPSAWISSNGFNADGLKSITMPDNSQSSLVLEGYEIAIHIDFDGELKNNAFYALKIGGNITLRKIEYKATGGAMLRCVSNDYADESVTLDELANIEVIGQAVMFQGSFPT